MIPADLLDQLREKDPDLWEKIAETALSEYEYHDEEFNAWISNTITYTDLFGPAQEAWLQHCLQEAIRARAGWSYCVSNTYQSQTHIKPIMAMVFTGKESYWRDGDTEAEALLRAYLSALSGERI